jgi:hypothetical protein
MLYNASCFISEYGLRTNENRLFLEDISDIYRDHDQDLNILSEISDNDDALEKMQAVVNSYSGKNISKETLKALFKVHSNHESRSFEAYLKLRNMLRATGNDNTINIPRHLYFDGTQLINSLFGLIVLPMEGYKDIRQFSVYEENMEEYAREEYHWIKDYILEIRRRSESIGIEELSHRFHDIDTVYLSNYRDTNYYNGEGNPVMAFFHHIRNSLAHSGSGNIHFFPVAANESGNQVTHMVFYDTYMNTRNYYREIPLHFYVKMPIEDVICIANRAQALFASLNNMNPHLFTHDEIINRLRETNFRNHR